MSYTGQAFDHALIPLKSWPSPYALDIVGKLSANVNIGSSGLPAQPGTVVHVASLTSPATGKPGPNGVVFEMGALSAQSNNVYQVPLFLWSGSDHSDVTNPGVPAGTAIGGTVSTPPAWIPGVPAGDMLALVAMGAYEFETTEFDTSKTYYPGQPLRCVSSNTDTNAGKLTNVNGVTNQTFTGADGTANGGLVQMYVDTVVAFVSRGTYTNGYGRSVLAIWPHFLPGTR